MLTFVTTSSWTAVTQGTKADRGCNGATCRDARKRGTTRLDSTCETQTQITTRLSLHTTNFRYSTYTTKIGIQCNGGMRLDVGVNEGSKFVDTITTCQLVIRKLGKS